MDTEKIVVERDRPGRPYEGRVFIAVQAHLDDIPHHAAGLCAKLVHEGYTGYIVRTSNDEKRGGKSAARNILSNEQEHIRMAHALGCKDVFEFYYQNHEMNGISSLDIRGRLIFLIRMLKADTVLSFNPWGHGEENPDHWVTGRAVEEAAWMSGVETDYPEHMDAGFAPQEVRARYYFCARPGQPYNRVVDISSHIEKKLDAYVECRSQGGGDYGSKLRARLAREGKRLPLFGNDDRTADREYVRQFLLDEDREVGRAHGFHFAERFFYVGESPTEVSKVEAYVKRYGVSL
jgi:LmbE family N-acetylglucosaminyl deacetylase